MDFASSASPSRACWVDQPDRTIGDVHAPAIGGSAATSSSRCRRSSRRSADECRQVRAVITSALDVREVACGRGGGTTFEGAGLPLGGSWSYSYLLREPLRVSTTHREDPRSRRSIRPSHSERRALSSRADGPLQNDRRSCLQDSMIGVGSALRKAARAAGHHHRRGEPRHQTPQGPAARAGVGRLRRVYRATSTCAGRCERTRST